MGSRRTLLAGQVDGTAQGIGSEPNRHDTAIDLDTISALTAKTGRKVVRGLPSVNLKTILICVFIYRQTLEGG